MKRQENLCYVIRKTYIITINDCWITKHCNIPTRSLPSGVRWFPLLVSCAGAELVPALAGT